MAEVMAKYSDLHWLIGILSCSRDQHVLLDKLACTLGFNQDDTANKDDGPAVPGNALFSPIHI